MPSLPVDLNRERLHAVETSSDFRADGPFEVLLRNHGEAVHVHLHLDDDLASVASLSDGNHYVERDAELRVPVSVAPVDGETRGRLKIVSGYGAEQQHVSVTVAPTRNAKPAVDVDESLSKPAQRPEREREELFDLGDRRLPALVGLAVLFVVIVVVGLVVDQAFLLLAAGILLGGVAVGVLTRQS